MGSTVPRNEEDLPQAERERVRHLRDGDELTTSASPGYVVRRWLYVASRQKIESDGLAP